MADDFHRQQLDVHALLEPDADYLSQTWTDTVLRATFLRVAIRDELVWYDKDIERKRSEAFAGLINAEASSEHDVVLEVLIAACLDKANVPLSDENFKARIRALTPDGCAEYLLERLIEERAPLH